MIEMSRTHPPLVPDVFDPEYRAALADVMARFTPSEMVGAHRWMGTETDRIAGGAFTAGRLGAVPEPGRVVVTNGTQSAFAMLFGGLVGRGGALAVESLTYPPVLVLAERLGFRPLPVAMDGEGMLPDALDALCRRDRPKAVYVLSTLQNPTTATMSLDRRRAIVDVCRRHDVEIVEDDVYSLLPETRLPPLSALAPERGWYMLGVAKCLAAGMKLAYVVAPSAARAEALFWPGVRATFWMAAPISAAVGTRLIESGAAARIIDAVRAEMRERHRIILSDVADLGGITADGALHIWMTLPAGVSADSFAQRIRQAGVNIATAAPYAPPGETAPQAIRIGIGHARSRDELVEAFRRISGCFRGDR